MNAVVKVTIANLHEKTDIHSELVDEVLYGMPVEIIEDIDETWVKVRTFYRYEGYTLKMNLEISSETLADWIVDSNHVEIQ